MKFDWTDRGNPCQACGGQAMGDSKRYLSLAYALGLGIVSNKESKLSPHTRPEYLKS